MAGGFQTSVGTVPAPAVEGDFCDTNPRYSVDAGPGGLVAGLAGLTVGRFAWVSYEGIDPDNAPTIANNYGAGVPDGFVAREQQGLITTYLDQSGMVIPRGFGVTLFKGGGFWVKNAGSGQAVRGMKAYAKAGTGEVLFAAAGTPATASVTGSIGAVVTTSFTGAISGNVLTVSALSTGTIYPGATLSGTGGGGVASGTKVVGQLSGTTGGVGTYAVTPTEQTVTSTTITAAAGLLNVTAVGSGTLAVGDVLSGSGGGGVTSGTVISALGTGTGLTGTYIVDPTQTVSSTTVAANTSAETRFTAVSAGNAGELVKISDRYQ